MKIKQEIEYEEAPCGYATFYNYKEPLMKFTEGYGFVGALVFDGKTDKIQCHFCGEWLGSLPHHLRREHNMTASEYKERVGLLQTTALISESARAKLIASGLDKRLQNLRAGGKMTKEVREKIRATCKKNGSNPEQLNLHGTCPEQLIARMQKIARENGDKLRMRDFDNFDEIVIKTYGSIKNACEIAGIPYREVGRTLKNELIRKSYTDDRAINFIREYIVRFNKSPKRRDFTTQKEHRLYDRVVKNEIGLKRLTTLAYASLPEYRKSAERMNYTDEQLLDFLRKFEKINGRRPALSDAKRCLVPYPSAYYYHFGNWNNALAKAFNK